MTTSATRGQLLPGPDHTLRCGRHRRDPFSPPAAATQFAAQLSFSKPRSSAPAPPAPSVVYRREWIRVVPFTAACRSARRGTTRCIGYGRRIHPLPCHQDRTASAAVRVTTSSQSASSRLRRESRQDRGRPGTTTHTAPAGMRRREQWADAPDVPASRRPPRSH